MQHLKTLPEKISDVCLLNMLLDSECQTIEIQDKLTYQSIY